MPVGRVTTEQPVPARVRRPWTGKVHNPRAIWEKEQAEKRTMTQADFLKFTKEGLELRFKKLETRQDAIEKLLSELVEAIKK